MSTRRHPHCGNELPVGADLDRSFGTKDGYGLVVLFKFDQALYTEKLVSATSLRKAFTPYIFESGIASKYGFGWFIEENDGKKMVYHGGSWVGFKNSFVREIDEGNTYIFFSNFADSPNSEMRADLPRILREAMRN